MTTDTITAQNWQLSTAGIGQVAQGLDDISQAIILIVTTRKGSDPLRPEFGSDADGFVDRPPDVAAVNITRSIIDAVVAWEPRVVLTDVSHTFNTTGRIDFRIGWQLVGGEVSGSADVSFGDFATPAALPQSAALATFINPTVSPTQVKSLNWQFATDGPGRVVQGIQDIGQAILLAVATQKGSDPLRPEFGSDIFLYIDQPLPTAGPNMVQAIREAVDLWEPRVKLLGVRYAWQDERGENKRYPAGIRFELGWRLRGGKITGQTDILLGLSDQYLNDVLNPPITSAVFYILATESLNPLVGEDFTEILVEL